MDESFGKKEKLKSSILIGRLFKEGKSLTKYPLKLVYLPVERSDFTTHRTAVSVPKRNFKKAVERNFLKRLVREVFRKNKYLVTSNMNSTYAFLWIYIGREKQSYLKLNSVAEELLKKFVEKEKN